MKMRVVVAALALGAVGIALGVIALAGQKPAAPPAGSLELVVYKTPTCGCCGKWVEHMEAAGFKATVHDLPDLSAIKGKTGVPGNLQSCHTATIDGYVVEGHIPADVVQKLLKERPGVVGIAVPGMPTGSPGMEYGDHKDPYDVLTFDRSGRTTVFARR